MSYTIEQKIGKHIYVYEVESYWDSEKKQPRQRRRYLGKKDPETGEVITPRKSKQLPRVSRDFGHVYLLKHIAKETGLKEALQEVFGAEADDILNLAYYCVSEGRPLYLYRQWAEMTALEGGARVLSSQQISRLLKDLGRQEALRESFFGDWIYRQKDIKAIVFDITSVSSYSKWLELLEWGYNRDGEHLRQINFGVVIGRPSGLPIGYRVYPGSITDVVTLKNLMEYLRAKGLRQYCFVLDRGFYSERNLNMMADEGIEFIIPVPFSTALAKAVLSRHLRELDSTVNAFVYEGQAYFYAQGTVEVGSREVVYHIYSNDKARAEAVEGLLRRLTAIEDAVKARELKSVQEVEAFIEEQMKGGSRFYSITETSEGIVLQRKQKALARRINRMGKMILLCSDGTKDRVDVLSTYRKKDFLEKVFEVMKNEIDGGRLRVRDKDSLEGRLFVMFIALIVYMALSNKMREKELYKKYTLSEVLFELKKLRQVEMMNGQRYLTEMTKRQRSLYEALEVPLPDMT